MKQWLVRRGVLATVPVASLVLAFGACSSESAPPTGDDSASTKAGKLPQMGGAELAADPTAARRLARLTKQFVRAPQQAEAPRSHAFPAGVVPPKAQPASEVIPARPVLSKGEANAFVRQGERFRAEIDPSAKEKVIKHANVDLPATANGFVRIQADRSSIGVEFATQRARGDSELTVAEGVASYASGAPEGGDILFRVTADAVEDFVVLEKRPATARIDYTVKVSEVPGLRLYDNTLEFLDATGDPQIRVKPPRVVDADGVMHEAKLAIAGCKYDSSGQLPWDRPVTAPGAAECKLSVTWNDQQVAYPAIVDPVWATAGSLAVARYRAAAVRLSSGYVMTCGGIGDIGVALASCETFNPAGNGGAGTWASATAMGTARNDHTLFVLSPASTDVLAVGGNNVYTSERLAAGVWTASTGDFGTIAGCPQCTPYFSPQMPAKTSDGKYVVLVDYAATPYVFTTATNTWTVGTQNPSPIQQYRYSSMVLTIPGQSTIMRLGGEYSGTTFTTGERYNPATNSWAAPGNAAAMTVPRSSAAVAILDPNRVMVYGGYTGAAYSSTAEIYNATANTWAFSTGPIPNGQSAGQWNRGVTYAFHGSGKMLSNTDQGMYIYDPAAAATPWAVLNPNNFNNLGSQANVASAGAKVLMVPVWPSGGPSGAQTACRLFDFGDKGSQCSSTGECQSGLTCVVDSYWGGYGVCCDTACSGACSSCQAAHKTSGVADGTCGPRKSNEYVGETACPPTAATTCGTSGYYCDGAGACAKWSNTTQCAAGSCLDGDTQNDIRYCDGKGTCTAQTSTDCTTGYQCSGSACQTQCYNNTDYCTSNYYCQDFQSPYYTCQPKKSNGSACSYPVECTTGNCVDGVCCDLACDGLCEACTNALTGSSDGSCKPIATGTDPQDDCDNNGAGSCDQNGLCNGAGACQLYASGTQCDDIGTCASETSRYIPDTCNGTGSCVDKGSQACSTGYSCQAGVCNTQCTSDAQCASSYWCDTVSKVCVADRTSGQSCARDAACTGNANCVDGVCCNSACTGTCRSCLKNQTGLSADGLCGDILDDTDPANECTIDVAYPTSCKAPGTCNGAGACRVYAKNGVVSAANTCSGSTLTSKTCDGAGNQQVLQTPCYPYKCNAGNTACRVACTEGTAAQDCDDDSFCQNGVCVGQKPLGTACNAGTECKSGYCADQGIGALEGDVDPGTGEGGAPGEPVNQPGVCCDTACGSPCDACKKSIKGQGSDGTCGFVKDHTDPADDCPIDASNPCGYNGECNGAGACRNVPSGTSCGDTTCVGNSVQGQRCDGEGACVNNDGTTACAPYVCRDVNGAEQCTNPCAADDDCQDGYYCVEQSCKKKLANGATCDTSGICSSGFCVDGVCCDTSCNGQCAACDNAGSEGICSAVKGEPHGNRTQCDHAGEECGGSCDGVNASACKYVANGTACGETTCDNGTAKSSECNGQGECRANKDQQCSPFVCGTDDTCLTLCEQDADCSQGFACDETTQRCLPAVVAAECSEDRLSSVGQNGISTPCKPFLCVPASGTCAVSCAFTTDCAPDFVCEASTKTCLPTPPESEVEDESCACRAAGAAPTRHGYLALALFGLALGGLRRRKRSRNCPARSAKPAGFAQGPHPFE
jgi:MYXO-CTERM domain-containing protein